MDNYSFANNSHFSPLNSQLLSPAFQAVVDGVMLSASCASLACGYENQDLRAAGKNVITATSLRDDSDNIVDANHFQFSIFNFQLNYGDNIT
jgi:hypothetical protein